MVHPNTNRTGPRLEWPTLFVFGVHKQTHFVLLTSSVLGMSRCCLGNRACVGLCSVDPVPLLFHHHHRGRRQCWHQQTTQTPVTETTLILIRFCILHLDFFSLYSSPVEVVVTAIQGARVVSVVPTGLSSLIIFFSFSPSAVTGATTQTSSKKHLCSSRTAFSRSWSSRMKEMLTLLAP